MKVTWSKEYPTKTGWYKHRKDGHEKKYYLQIYGFFTPNFPESIIVAKENPESLDGKNIMSDFYEEFIDCEWCTDIT